MAANSAMGDFTPLIGTDEATLDDKGRITITIKKAMRLREGFVAAIGKLGCLTLYPEAIWKSLAAEVFAMPVLHPAREEFTRTLMSTAADGINFDQQNRIVIPQDLREAAKLQSGVRLKIVGCGDRVEIWSEKAWSDYSLQTARKDESREAAIERTYSPIATQAFQDRRTDQETAKESGA